MNYYTFLQRPRFIILGLLLLVALLLLLWVPALNLTAPAIQGAPAANEAAVDGTSGDLASGIHAADRKFYDNGYASGGSAPLDAYSVEVVHPADRKFLDAIAADRVGAGIEIHPADRKFLDASAADRVGARAGEQQGSYLNQGSALRIDDPYFQDGYAIMQSYPETGLRAAVVAPPTMADRIHFQDRRDARSSDGR